MQAKASFLDKLFEASHWLAEAFHEQNSCAGPSVCGDCPSLIETCSQNLKHKHEIFCVTPYKDYQNIVQKLNSERKYHRNARLQAAHYKISRDGYKRAFEKSQNRWEESKGLIKSWQDYHDQQQSRISSAQKLNSRTLIKRRSSTTPPMSLPTLRRGSSSSATSINPSSLKSVPDVLAKDANIPSAFSLTPVSQSPISPGLRSDLRVSSLDGYTSQAKNVKRFPRILENKLAYKSLVEDSEDSDDLLEEVNCIAIEEAGLGHVRDFDEGESLIGKPLSTPTKGHGDLRVSISRARVSPDLRVLCAGGEMPGELEYILPAAPASATEKPKLDSNEGQELVAAEQTKKLTSSQSTEDEVEPGDIHGKGSIAIETDLSSDPVVVSSRSLKRKRGRVVVQAECQGARKLYQHQDGSDQKPITIKDENNSSPIGTAAHPSLAQQSSIDLDEYRDIVALPGKSRQLQRMTSRSVVHMFANNSRHGRASSLPPNSDRNQGLRNGFTEKLNQHSANDLRTCDRLDQGEKENFEEPRSYFQSYMTSDERDEAAGAQQGGTDKQTVLQPLSVNKKILPRTGATKSGPNSRRIRDAMCVGEVAEDGERYTLENKQKNRIANVNSAISVSRNVLHAAPDISGNVPRINTLLETSSPAKHVLWSSEGKTAPRSSPVKDIRQAGATASNKRARKTEKFETKLDAVRPEHEPLRARPLWRLGLDDFKINTKVNKGYDFAFSEVIRNQEERHYLPGCTRPECCGHQFQKMIELGGPLQTRSKGIWDSSQGDEDQHLLGEYLGDDRSRLEYMTVGEKTETLIKARAQQLAQRHGKHREVFQRRSTPPGFWRADMPTTQETVQDKERSKQMERQKVGERFAEALKINGRWVFRDE